MASIDYQRAAVTSAARSSRHRSVRGVRVERVLETDATRPAWYHFVALGLLAGAPVILGGWIGGLAYSPTLGAFFLALGVGAILQVDWEIAAMIRRRQGCVASAFNLLAFLAGFVVMYATDLLVAL